MSWRLIATILIAVFALVTLWTVTAQPMHTVTDSIVEIDDGEGGQYDTEQTADSYLRGYFNTILVLVFGLIAYGAWFVLRRELTEGRL